MSDPTGEERGARPVRRSLGEGGFDAAIDGAVREMLDVEPPPGLRGRVFQRIEAQPGTRAGSTFGFRKPVVSAFFFRNPVVSAFFFANPVVSAFRRKALWIAAPVAAAAVILLAMLAPWRHANQSETSAPPAIARNEPRVVIPPPQAPRSAAPTPGRSVPAPLPHVNPPAAPRKTAAGSVVTAAAAAAEADVVWVNPLSPPSALAVADIETARVRTVNSIDPVPAEIPALEVRPISESPRERRNQE